MHFYDTDHETLVVSSDEKPLPLSRDGIQQRAVVQSNHSFSATNARIYFEITILEDARDR
jgi:hypothetical protein